ncbi:MAG: TetR/AcrR family transcriptional regulator [Bryobacteraceae bacterium]|nr:TetR/AcrR family transcriptional regulator [Bryobacteraceae bacterium]
MTIPSTNPAAAPPHQRPRMTAEERKAAIVQAAVKLFSEKGFRGATTRELAAAVGVTEPILYQHFGTKRDLYSAIIESSCRVQEGQTDPQLEQARLAEDDRAFFTRLGELLLGWHAEQPHMLRLLLFSALEGHEYSELFFERQIVTYYRVLTEYLEGRMKKKVFRQMDPLLAARAFTGMVAHHGMVVTIYQNHDLGGRSAEIVAEFVRIFLDGMRTKTA